MVLKIPPLNPPTAVPINTPFEAATATAAIGPIAVPAVNTITAIAATTKTIVTNNFQCSLHQSATDCTPSQMCSITLFSHSGFR